MDTEANAIADAGGSAIALPGLRPGELKKHLIKSYVLYRKVFFNILGKYITWLHISSEPGFQEENNDVSI